MRPLAGPLLFFFLIALVMMFPFRSSRPTGSAGGDLMAHLSAIVEARRALDEGQFPIRIAPTQQDGARYAIFQFYGNFPYTLAAVLSSADKGNPYTGWKLANLLGLTVAGFYTYRAGLLLTKKVHGSIVGGAVFQLAPYLWTDLHARFAYTETISVCLLPAVMFYSLLAFRKRGVAPIVLAGISWSLLALSHNVTFLYALAFVALFVLLLQRPSRFGGTICAGMGAVVGGILTLWYVLPQLHVLHLLTVASFNQGTPHFSRMYTSLDVLLSPWLKVPEPAIGSTNTLGPQVGWPILMGVLIAIGAAIFTRRGRLRLQVVLALFVCLAAAFFLVWSPGDDFWIYLPRHLHYVQFTYRILAFVMLFGALLVPFAFFWIKQKRSFTAALVSLLLVGLAASSYYPDHPKELKGVLQSIRQRPNIGEGGAAILYRVTPENAAKLGRFHPNMQIRPFGFDRATNAVYLTAPDPDGRIIVEAELFDPVSGPVPLEATLGPERLATVQVEPGPFRQSFAFKGPFPTSPIVLRFSRGLRITLVSYEYDRLPDHPPLIGPEHLQALRIGSPTTLRMSTTQDAIVCLPVLWYPDLVQLTDNGERINTFNLDRFIAADLPPGDHHLVVQFVGVRWANWVSGIGWLLAGGILLMAFLKRLRARKALKLRKRGDFPFTAAFPGIGVILLGICVVPLIKLIADWSAK